MQPQIYPWKLTFDPPQLTPGGQARITIELNETATSDLTLSLTASPGGFFDNLPSSVTVTQGNDQIALDVTVAQNQNGACTVLASCSAGMAAGACVASPASPSPN